MPATGRGGWFGVRAGERRGGLYHRRLWGGRRALHSPARAESCRALTGDTGCVSGWRRIGCLDWVCGEEPRPPAMRKRLRPRVWKGPGRLTRK